MNKKEFLDTLYNQLSGQMSEGTIASYVQYYRNYIEEEQRKGRTESEILAELGDPHLITRTLLDTESAGSGAPQSGNPYSDSRQRKVRQHSFHLDLTTWYGKLTVILIALIVIILLCTVLSVLIPIMIIAGVLMYVFRLRKR